MSSIIKGGLELTGTDFLKNTQLKTNFDPVLSMLINPSSTLDLITASSLKGFIFKLNVPKSVSSYTEYRLKNNNTESFMKDEVESFALKFVVISDSEKRLPVFIDKKTNERRNKATDTANDFINEARIQQDIWRESYKKKGGEIAPSLGNITFIQGNKGIVEFLTYLKTHSNTTYNAKQVLIYLIDNIFSNSSYVNSELGILLMENYKNSKTFSDYFKYYKDNKPNHNLLDEQTLKELKRVYLTIRQNIIIKIIRLALLGYIHLDLHGGNSLINTDDGTCVIIDYGRAVNVKNGIDKFLNYISKNKNVNVQDIKRDASYNELKGAFDTLETNLKNILKKNKDSERNTIETIIDSIHFIDKFHNRYIYGKDYSQFSSLLYNFNGDFSNDDFYTLNDRFYKYIEDRDIPDINRRNIYKILNYDKNAFTVNSSIINEQIKDSTITNRSKKQKLKRFLSTINDKSFKKIKINENVLNYDDNDNDSSNDSIEMEQSGTIGSLSSFPSVISIPPAPSTSTQQLTPLTSTVDLEPITTVPVTKTLLITSKPQSQTPIENKTSDKYNNIDNYYNELNIAEQRQAPMSLFKSLQSSEKQPEYKEKLNDKIKEQQFNNDNNWFFLQNQTSSQLLNKLKGEISVPLYYLSSLYNSQQQKPITPFKKQSGGKRKSVKKMTKRMHINKKMKKNKSARGRTMKK